MIVLDTNAIIYHFAGDAAAESIILTHLSEGQTVIVPTVVVTEFLAYSQIKEEDISRLDFLLGSVDIAPLDLPLARTAGRLRKDYKMSLGDAVVAATALSFRAALVTAMLRI